MMDPLSYGNKSGCLVVISKRPLLKNLGSNTTYGYRCMFFQVCVLILYIQMLWTVNIEKTGGN